MKTTDIHRIRDAGLITEDQSAAIIDHFKLDQQANKLMIILGAVGALLVGSGIILLLAANWADIPRGVKLAAAIAALIGAHYSGWRLAQSGDHPVVSAAMHLTGSILFLANIALVVTLASVCASSASQCGYGYHYYPPGPLAPY